MSYQYLKEHKDFRRYIEKMKHDIFLTKKLYNDFKKEVDTWDVKNLNTEEIKNKLVEFGHKNKLTGELFTESEGLIFGHFMSISDLNDLLFDNSRIIEQKIEAFDFLRYNKIQQQEYLPFIKKPVSWIFLDDNVDKCLVDREDFQQCYAVLLRKMVKRLAISSNKELFFCFRKEHNIHRPTILDAGNNAFNNWRPGGRTSPNGMHGLCEFVINSIDAKNIIGRIKKYDF